MRQQGYHSLKCLLSAHTQPLGEVRSGHRWRPVLRSDAVDEDGSILVSPLGDPLCQIVQDEVQIRIVFVVGRVDEPYLVVLAGPLPPIVGAHTTEREHGICLVTHSLQTRRVADEDRGIIRKRHRSYRHRGWLLAGVAAAMFGGLLPSARGGCVGPQLEIVKPSAQGDRPARLTVGESVTAKGLYWLIGCDERRPRRSAPGPPIQHGQQQHYQPDECDSLGSNALVPDPVSYTHLRAHETDSY